MTGMPLIAGYAREGPLGVGRYGVVHARRYLAAASALATRLPPQGKVLLLCEDRVAFAIGFAAVLARGMTALLPPSRAPRAIERIVQIQQPVCALVDRPGTVPGLTEIVVDAGEHGDETSEIPRIDGDLVAVIAHTSGTTGDPQPHAKTWSSLVRGARALRERLGFDAGDTIVGAVPAQHMWGLEATILLALQNGGVIHAGTPLLPADIAAALGQATAPRWLVVTPLHIRSCVQSRITLPSLAAVLTATSPLAPDVARRFEAQANAPVIEIYGSTETGITGTRRTVEALAFAPMAGVVVAVRDEGIGFRGGHLDREIVVRDRAHVLPDGCFELQGRDADLVKIGGKRGSLAMLNDALLAIDGVVDGAFVVADDGADTQRLAALVVAPSTSAVQILAALRERIDAVFLPRPLHFVDALPRNAMGKLPAASLRELLAAAASRAASRSQVREILVPADHPALPGHFAGRPIVPAAWIVTLVSATCAEAWGCAPPALQIVRARFRSPLQPGIAARIELERGNGGTIAFICSQAGQRIADGMLVERPAT